MTAIMTRLADNKFRQKKSALKEYVFGVFIDTGIGATHDACNTDWTTVIRDDGSVGVEHNISTIEQGQPLTGFCQPYLNGTLQLVEIESMHGLSQFEHHVIGDINSRVDRSHTTSTQTFNHPAWRTGLHVNIANHSGCKAHTGGSIINQNRPDLFMLRRDRIYFT